MNSNFAKLVKYPDKKIIQPVDFKAAVDNWKERLDILNTYNLVFDDNLAFQYAVDGDTGYTTKQDESEFDEDDEILDWEYAMEDWFELSKKQRERVIYIARMVQMDVECQRLFGEVVTKYDNGEYDTTKDFRGMVVDELQNITDLPLTTVSLTQSNTYKVVNPFTTCTGTACGTQPCRANMETNMYRDATIEVKDTDIEKRRYLSIRLNDIYSEKIRKELRPTFKMDEPPAPVTVDDFVNRVKAGEFTFPDHIVKEGLEDDSWQKLTHYISWRKPGEKPDEKGFNAAQEKLCKKVTEAHDIIKVLPIEKGYDALKAFESTTVH